MGGIPSLDNNSAHRILHVIAPLQPRNFVVMELKGNLTASDRLAALSVFKNPSFRSVAVVLIGEPTSDFKARTHAALLEEKQGIADAAFRTKMAEVKRKRLLEKREKEEERRKLKLQKKVEAERKRRAEEMEKKTGDEADKMEEDKKDGQEEADKKDEKEEKKEEKKEEQDMEEQDMEKEGRGDGEEDWR